ncbi:hypothetical protein [Luteolibacter sp. AS25]|uniref:hypothetical protein n=1 Tax=Luteolibacter sp. AS25 TaxID=3135776 RepID=UPI00398A9A53
MSFLKWALLSVVSIVLCQCAGSSGGSIGGPPNMGGPTVEQRSEKIANEQTGDFYYGRRYYVNKTRFWGYLRKPRQSADQAKLVLFDERSKYAPDRKSESGPPGARYGYDNNYEYRISGNYTGKEAYDPNSDQFLPVFRLTNYQLVETSPGWLFSPNDHYDQNRFTLMKN